jgi:hypothetical protein
MISVPGLPRGAVLCNQKTRVDEMLEDYTERTGKSLVPSPYETAKADAATTTKTRKGRTKAPQW